MVTDWSHSLRGFCLKVYTDTAAGTKADRPQRIRCLDDLRPTDTLVIQIWKIDRLGRNLRDLIDIVTTIDRQLRRAEQEPAHIRCTALYAVLAREIMAPEGTWRAFAIHPDRTAVPVDLHGRVRILRPGPTGLYDLGPLGDVAAAGQPRWALCRA